LENINLPEKAQVQEICETVGRNITLCGLLRATKILWLFTAQWLSKLVVKATY